MKYKIILAAILGLAVELTSTSKARRFRYPFKVGQSVKIDNNAKSESNAVAIKE
jgi:hypothetical protein